MLPLWDWFSSRLSWIGWWIKLCLDGYISGIWWMMECFFMEKPSFSAIWMFCSRELTEACKLCWAISLLWLADIDCWEWCFDIWLIGSCICSCCMLFELLSWLTWLSIATYFLELVLCEYLDILLAFICLEESCSLFYICLLITDSYSFCYLISMLLIASFMNTYRFMFILLLSNIKL